MRLYKAVILSTGIQPFCTAQMAFNSNTNEKTERCSSQMAKEQIGRFLKGQSNKRRGQSQSVLHNAVLYRQYSERRRRWFGRAIRMDH